MWRNCPCVKWVDIGKSDMRRCTVIGVLRMVESLQHRTHEQQRIGRPDPRRLQEVPGGRKQSTPTRQLTAPYQNRSSI